MSYWAPVMASCKAERKLAAPLYPGKEMEQGVEREPLLDLFSVDEFLALAVYSIETVNESPEKLLLDHMTESFVSRNLRIRSWRLFRCSPVRRLWSFSSRLEGQFRQPGFGAGGC